MTYANVTNNVTAEEVCDFFVAGFLHDHPQFGERYARGLWNEWYSGRDYDSGGSYRDGYDDGYEAGCDDTKDEYGV